MNPTTLPGCGQKATARYELCAPPVGYRPARMRYSIRWCESCSHAGAVIAAAAGPGARTQHHHHHQRRTTVQTTVDPDDPYTQLAAALHAAREAELAALRQRIAELEGGDR